MEEEALHLSAHPALSHITQVDLTLECLSAASYSTFSPHPDGKEGGQHHTFEVLSAIIFITINGLPVTNGTGTTLVWGGREAKE